MMRSRYTRWVLLLCCIWMVPGQAFAAPKKKLDPRLVRVMKQLQSKQWRQRVLAAKKLSRLGPGAAPAASLLLGLLKDKQAEVRGAATFALGAIGPAAARAIPALVRGIQDKHPWVRGFSAFALARMGPLAHKVLYKRLSSKQAKERILCAISLARVDSRPKAWNKKLRSVLYEAPAHKTSWIRFYAVQSLRKMRSTHLGTLHLLEKTIHDKHKKVRDATLRTLRYFGPAAKALIPTLLKLRKSKVPKERRLAMQALGRIASKNNAVVIAALKRDYVSPQYVLRWEAWRALGHLGVKLPKASLNGPIPIGKRSTSRPTTRPATRPTTRRPTTRRPTTRRPTTRRPTTRRPVARRPAASRPVVKRPIPRRAIPPRPAPRRAAPKPSTRPTPKPTSRPVSRPVVRR